MSVDNGIKKQEIPERVSLFSKEQLSVFNENELRGRCKPMATALRDFLS
jgi:hypothetical protein